MADLLQQAITVVKAALKAKLTAVVSLAVVGALVPAAIQELAETVAAKAVTGNLVLAAVPAAVLAANVTFP